MGLFWTVPNILALSRPLVGLPAIYFSLRQDLIFLALILFLGFALTDLVDGWYARKNKVVTLWGKLLDPAADKLFFILTPVLIGIPPALSKQFIVLIILEITLATLGLIGLIMQLRGNQSRIEVSANSWGKKKTLMESVFIGLLFIGKLGLDLNIQVLNIILWFAMGLAILSLWGHIKGHLNLNIR